MTNLMNRFVFPGETEGSDAGLRWNYPVAEAAPFTENDMTVLAVNVGSRWDSRWKVTLVPDGGSHAPARTFLLKEKDWDFDDLVDGETRLTADAKEYFHEMIAVSFVLNYETRRADLFRHLLSHGNNMVTLSMYPSTARKTIRAAIQRARSYHLFHSAKAEHGGPDEKKTKKP